MSCISIAPDFQEVIDLLQNLPDATSVSMRRSSDHISSKSNTKTTSQCSVSSVTFSQPEIKSCFSVTPNPQFSRYSSENLFNNSDRISRRTDSSEINSNKILTSILKKVTQSTNEDYKINSNTLPLKKRSPCNNISSSSTLTKFSSISSTSSQLLSTSCSAITSSSNSFNKYQQSSIDPKTNKATVLGNYKTSSLSRRSNSSGKKNIPSDFQKDNQLSTVC